MSFDDVFQLETIEGANWWHGYLKVDFLDPWDGVNLESYMAIDFIELAVNTDSLGGFGVNTEDRRFEEIRIGDIDGFGWGDGALSYRRRSCRRSICPITILRLGKKGRI